MHGLKGYTTPWGDGTPKWTYDAVLNDSDKSYTTPAGKMRVYLMVRAQLNTTATVGNRTLVASVTDGTNVVWTSRAGGSIAAGGYGGMQLSNTDAPSTTDFRRLDNLNGNVNPAVRDVLPSPFVLPAGYVLRIHDSAAIDAAADDLYVAMHYVEYDA